MLRPARPLLLLFRDRDRLRPVPACLECRELAIVVPAGKLIGVMLWRLCDFGIAFSIAVGRVSRRRPRRDAVISRT